MATKKEMIKEIVNLNVRIAIKYGDQILEEKDWLELRGRVRASRKQLEELEEEYE